MSLRKIRSLLFIACVLFSLSCNSSGTKTIDLDFFQISVPKSWKFKSIKTIDSFAGELIGPEIVLGFDYSEQGLASTLYPTEKQYLDYVWLIMHHSPEDARGLIPVPDGQRPLDIASAERMEMQKRYLNKASATTSKDTLVTFIKSYYNTNRKSPEVDYWAIVKYNGRVDTIPVNIPSEIKQENFKIDTIGKYIIKTIWPKVGGKGLTGVGIYKIDSDFTFNLGGNNLSAKNQQLALKAFKTIKFKL